MPCEVRGEMRIHQNPNGFAVVTLYEAEGFSERIHAWGDHVADSDIHQHRRDYVSTVLEGFFNEEIWTYEDDPDGDWERMTVDCLNNEETYKVKVFETVRCRVKIAEVLVHREGSTYERKATDLHRVFPVQCPVVTRCTFGPVTNRIHTMIRKIEE